MVHFREIISIYIELHFNGIPRFVKGMFENEGRIRAGNEAISKGL
jgi:hypothetical protein